MKKLIFLLIILLYSSVGINILLAQIGSKVQASKTSLAGNWSNNQFGFTMILQLNTDGSGTFDGEKISYTSTATTLSVKQDGETTVYKYALQNGKLTLSGGDLDAPIAFAKDGGTGNAPSQANTSPTPQKSSNTNSTDLLGTWSVNGETVVFNADKTGTYNGNRFNYSIAGNTLTTSDPVPESPAIHQAKLWNCAEGQECSLPCRDPARYGHNRSPDRGSRSHRAE